MIPRTIIPLPFTIEELNITERELVQNVEDVCEDKQLAIRLVRMIGNKFNFARRMVKGQEWLRRCGYITWEESNGIR